MFDASLILALESPLVPAPKRLYIVICHPTKLSILESYRVMTLYVAVSITWGSRYLSHLTGFHVYLHTYFLPND